MWSDADIAEGLQTALDTYSSWMLLEKRTTIAGVEGDLWLDLPADLVSVVRVVAPWGGVIPRRGNPMRSQVAEELAWEQWGDRLEFSRALTAGDYAIWYTATRTLPATDGGELPVPEADVTLLVVDAAVVCLDRLGVEEWKRGALPARYEVILRRARGESARLWATRRGRARMRTVDVSG
jgi:hypothetical protein